MKLTTKKPLRSTLSVFALAGAALSLSACEEPARPLSYYQANDDERRATLAACADNPAAQQQDGNCINAAAALNVLKEGLRQEKIAKIEDAHAAAKSVAAIPHLVEACGGLDGDTFKACRSNIRDKNAQLSEELDAINERIKAEYQAKLEAL